MGDASVREYLDMILKVRRKKKEYYFLKGYLLI